METSKIAESAALGAAPSILEIARSKAANNAELMTNGKGVSPTEFKVLLGIVSQNRNFCKVNTERIEAATPQIYFIFSKGREIRRI